MSDLLKTTCGHAVSMTLAIAAISSLPGCAMSIQPLATPEVRADVAEIEGEWVVESSSYQALKEGATVRVARRGVGTYHVDLTQAGRTTYWDGEAVLLGETIFVDLVPSFEIDPDQVSDYFMIATHAIFVLERKEQRVALYGFDHSKLDPLSMKEHVAVASPANHRIVYVADSKPLQEFFREHGPSLRNDESSVVLARKDAPPLRKDVPPNPGQPDHASSLIRGRVTVDGPIPEVPALKVKPELKLVIPRNETEERENQQRVRQAVEVEIPDDSLVVSAEGGIANVAIYLKRRPTGWQPSESQFESAVAVRCAHYRFQPRLSLVRVGQGMRLVAPKWESAHFRIQPLHSEAISILVPHGDSRDIAEPFTRSEPFPVEITSNIRPWQKAWLLALDHPFAAITDADGRFEIRDLPPGAHHLTVWHERRGILDKDIAIEIQQADAVKPVVELKYKAAQLQRREPVEP